MSSPMTDMFQRPWRRALPLPSWRSATTGPGLYIIGHRTEKDLDIGPCVDNDGKLGGFPDNFTPLYIGSSLSQRGGVRMRLYCHSQGWGNRGIAQRAAAGDDLWFIHVCGADMAPYEAIYLHVQAGFYFECNKRPELNRYLYSLGRSPEFRGFEADINPLASEYLVPILNGYSRHHVFGTGADVQPEMSLL